MEINQGIGKSHGPLPSCVTPFLKYTSMGNYLYCGVSLVVWPPNKVRVLVWNSL